MRLLLATETVLMVSFTRPFDSTILVRLSSIVISPLHSIMISNLLSIRNIASLSSELSNNINFALISRKCITWSDEIRFRKSLKIQNQTVMKFGASTEISVVYRYVVKLVVLRVAGVYVLLRLNDLIVLLSIIVVITNNCYKDMRIYLCKISEHSQWINRSKINLQSLISL